jgi:protein SCO1/2
MSATLLKQLSKRSSRSLALLILLATGLSLASCNRQTDTVDESGGFAVSDSPDVLQDLTLVDQHGQKVDLASLKGKPLLFDFFYTTCPGPCLMLTARMKSVANHLGPLLGSQVQLVSVTVDPEHDRPADLLNYTKQQGADRNGWLFLTGPPADIDRLMARFKLTRQHEPDGSVDHVLEFFLVGSDGHLQLQYVAFEVNPLKVAGDVEQAADGKRLVESAGGSNQQGQ